MNKFVTAVVIAAASFVVQRYLSRREASAPMRGRHVETWENEGGALAPQHAPVETSQVPR